jgi:hypothetical protein
VPSLSAIILARSNVVREIEAERMFLSGDALLSRNMQSLLHVPYYLPEDGLRELSAESRKARARC